MGDPQDEPPPKEDLARAVEARKRWFFECQLRWLNFDSFRGITALDAGRPSGDAFPDRRIDVVAEPLLTWGFPAGQIGGRMKDLGPVYLDDQQPVWSDDDRARHDTFEASFLGRIDNWLGYKSGVRLARRLADLRKKAEAEGFASVLDMDPELVKFGRRNPGADSGSMGRAVSRAFLADSMPWLIPELYCARNPDASDVGKWVENLETFTADYESELQIVVGGNAGQAIAADPREGGAYRGWIKFLIEASIARDAADSVKSRMLTLVPKPAQNTSTYVYDINIATNGYPMGPVDKYPFSGCVKYWKEVMKGSLGEAYVSKANSDMGLCLLMRTVYLLGTLPAGLGSDADLTWRARKPPGGRLGEFFAMRAKEEKVANDPDLRDRLERARAKLQVILEETAANPRASAPTFSPLAQEIVRQAIRNFKFWLDEPLRASSNDKLKKARGDTKIASGDDVQSEQEFWSENHYIMFASSEFLAGQLWEHDQFQPAKEFLGDPKSGLLSGADRKARGRARVLKWLNNRLMFGWMEFHSSGYYREHLWALLNLADFSLDAEIREKATLAIDLLLFDVARFLQKGTMGAAGGRSQFKSKSSGWDNALCDVVEILFGPRGIFGDADSQIGMSLATSTYKVPDVLLEIGSNPPATPFADRSRVSITFEEAPKYGIGYSLESDQKDSVMQGYAPKRAEHYPHLDAVNQEIARTHNGYGATEDDTIFWWGTSAFFNRQVVRSTFHTVISFGLDQSGVFGGAVPKLIRAVAGYEKVKHRGILGGIIGTVIPAIGTAAGVIAGVAEGLPEVASESLFSDPDLLRDLEAASDDLSVLLEGSTRTRANLYSYRTPDAMLSSIQNFRPGQFNFQSNVSQASLSPTINVFTTSGFEDIDISNLDAAIGGGLIGAALGAAVTVATGGAAAILAGAVLGAAGGIIGNEVGLKGKKTLANHEDGPGWWTGYWALPMVVQHESAAILAYDFHEIQDLLSESGTHAWFPKAGFDRVDEVRTSAYDDANFPLLDIGHIGPKGFWLFGKIVHPPEWSPERGEAYVGVFSNRRPAWQDNDSDFYKQQIKMATEQAISDKQGKIDDALEELEDNHGGGGVRDDVKAAVEKAVDETYRENINRDEWLKAAGDALGQVTDILIQANLDAANSLAEMRIDLKNLQRIWADPVPDDFFRDRDWYAEGKNVWIIQVGSRSEFGDFQTFKDRVSSARIHLDDAGDLECTYDIPRADGSSDRLHLAYGDGGQFGLNGGGFQTDLYPRFENPFVRGGRVEWGQREYVIEYRGKSLLHDFSDFANPVRREGDAPSADDRDTIKALVLFFRTLDEDMDAFTFATADVRLGCAQVARGQVVAAGPVDEETDHDAEWIFLDAAHAREPDMTLVFTHPASTKGDSTPHWTMGFRLRALMGDRSVRDCALSFAGFEFRDESRTTPRLPFSVSLSEWRPWAAVVDDKPAGPWTIARGRGFAEAYHDAVDLLAQDQARQLWHRRMMTCPDDKAVWSRLPAGGGGGPDLTGPFAMSAASAVPGSVALVVQSQGSLYAAWSTPSGGWVDEWSKLDLFTTPFLGIPAPVTLATLSPVVAVPSSVSSDGLELFVLAADGNIYTQSDWHPGAEGPWRTIGVGGFTPLYGAEFVVADELLLVLSDDRALWATTIDHGSSGLAASWERITPPGFAVGAFAAAREGGVGAIVAAGTELSVRATLYQPGSSTAWRTLTLPATSPAAGAGLVGVVPTVGSARFFTTGADGRIYTIACDLAAGWTEGQAWEAVAPDSQGFAPRASGALAATARVNGQVELFARDAHDLLAKAWWS